MLLPEEQPLYKLHHPICDSGCGSSELDLTQGPLGTEQEKTKHKLTDTWEFRALVQGGLGELMGYKNQKVLEIIRTSLFLHHRTTPPPDP